MPSVLIVDDEPRLRSQIARCVAEAGYSVAVASGVDEAAALLRERSFDAAVVDFRLDDGTGLDLLVWLKGHHPLCARLLMSGFMDLHLARGAIERGEVARVLSKPFKIEALPRLLEEAVANNRDCMAGPAEDPGERGRLEGALGSDAFQLALQPVIAARTGQVVGYEGFMRCDGPGFGDTGLVLDATARHRMFRQLTQAVVNRATGWLARMPDNCDLFLNLHPEELSDMGALMDHLGPLAPRAQQVVLDITGHHLERWNRVLRGRLEQLRALGFRFALDDLGAGQNGLLLLAEAEPGFIKADRSIVQGIDREPGRRRVVELLAQFAVASDATLVAEGVETPGEAEVLREIGVPLLQGYYFGRPSTERYLHA